MDTPDSPRKKLNTKGAFSEARLTQQKALELSRLLNFALGEAHSLYRLAEVGQTLTAFRKRATLGA